MPPKPSKVYRKLLSEGWKDYGGKGSHRKMKRDDQTIILPFHRKELSIGAWRSIKKQAGWHDR